MALNRVGVVVVLSDLCVVPSPGVQMLFCVSWFCARMFGVAWPGTPKIVVMLCTVRGLSLREQVPYVFLRHDGLRECVKHDIRATSVDHIGIFVTLTKKMVCILM
jgi:hypothetical protein